MRRVGRQEEHGAFMNYYVPEFGMGFGDGGIDDFEEHGAFVLVEPFGCLVDVVVGSGVGSAYDLGGGLLGA